MRGLFMRLHFVSSTTLSYNGCDVWPLISTQVYTALKDRDLPSNGSRRFPLSNDGHEHGVFRLAFSAFLPALSMSK
jgi:hypothetical protein